ncbi:alkyl hydroperoxide reductase subunit F [Erythrobacteraceae bacterium CFH 75059]|uniref:alkyl hydroperoxide reductase subunit F n=1 Tax=Qipengyuania thermophila TaxID=2509361 RepID=UPI00101FFF43|nr:alkyl hydroperoxide reductase subunit F [Qipengyuania thermophila]TCD01940.1 alkyl hydroperoxide reductase subunit F [Erythrobacteraceae bacterium CFH 75059]
MLDNAMQAQLRTYLDNLRTPVELVASLGDDEKSAQTRQLLEQIAALHPDVRFLDDGTDARRPSFIIRRAAEPDRWVRFAGLPLGHEFTSLVLALLWAGGHPPKVDSALLEQVRALEGEHAFEMYFSLSCHNCPDVVQALTLLALENPRVTATLIEGGTFRDEVEAREVMAVPAVFLDGKPFWNGRLDLAELLAKLDTGAEARAAAALDGKAPFDVLVIGGGPAATAAAVYTARKGIRTGVAAERFGGQLNDTLGIENLPGTPYTEGPKLAAQLESHVGAYGVDLMKAVAATALAPAAEPGGLHAVTFGNGATLRARTLVLATGARWRTLGVPGEQEYRNRGVAYCPHCDGPLFKGKRVGVVGGGNSGVEAAIDLANIVEHVTLVEYAETLRADEVLQRKLRSLPNVTIVTNAQTTEVIGDGARVTGIAYRDRATGAQHRLDLAGLFVQIGLVPNTEWLRDSGVALSPHGEIVIDEHGATSVPGIFAAGDATTVPYKQIVTAMGEGSKAALSAFDHLIRTDPAEPVARAA